MTNVRHFEPPNFYSGTYAICLKDDPTQIIEQHTISSKEEFDTILDSVIKYNNASEKEGPDRKLIKLEDSNK